MPLMALIVVAPLLSHGPSCGHDYGFHVQSWMDANEQLRHGILLPRWAFSPAFNAGEPRFVFYPPLSWLLGSVLLLLPAAPVTTAYTWLALTGAGLAMYALARRYTSPAAAAVAAAVYTGNPYLFFTAYERTAYAELLAAAWMPLLFRAAFAEELSALAIAVPLALLWLTNAPAAVMGTYALVLIVSLRLALSWRPVHTARSLLPMATSAAAGLLLGLTLPAFYLLPAAYERRYVQIAMAIIPNMRVEDNFLFGHTGYGPHDQVLHTATLVSLEVLALTGAMLLLAGRAQSRRSSLAGDTSTGPKQPVLPVLVGLSALIATLLWHFTLPVWHIVPELAFLQFPWRLLAVLGCVLGLATALALRDRSVSAAVAVLGSLAVIGVGTSIAYPPLRQGCDAHELPADRVALYRTHHGVGPTDEYTPTTADNDQLRWHDPAFWLAAQPNAPAPGTVPNPAATDPDYDAMPPLAETVSGRAPMHLTLRLEAAEDLILNLRDYPAWQVTVNGDTHAPHLQRDDGLLAVALPAGRSRIDIHWRTLPDVWAGDVVSCVALAATGWLWWRSGKIRYQR